MRLLKWALGAVGVLLVLAVGTWKVSGLRDFQFFGRIVSRVETAEKVVALTFDDGPSPANTEAVLGVLARHGVKATFFMVGFNIERYPALAARVLAEGHGLGNHSYSHPRFLFRSPTFVEEELAKTDALLRGLGVQGAIPFRAPYGKKLLVLPWVLARQGRTHVTFDVVPYDEATQDAELLTQRVLEATRPGSIILLHDGWGSKPGTVAATERIVQALKQQGYRFLTVEELLARGG
jgi:peptidoglycan/xylan/chitin deacetylase (PgdA/CDA1 family)